MRDEFAAPGDAEPVSPERLSVVGALAVSALDSFLAEAENGIKILGGTLDLPSGTRVIAEGALMALVLIFRPGGLTGGLEFVLRWRRK